MSNVLKGADASAAQIAAFVGVERLMARVTREPVRMVFNPQPGEKKIVAVLDSGRRVMVYLPDALMAEKKGCR